MSMSLPKKLIFLCSFFVSEFCFAGPVEQYNQNAQVYGATHCNRFSGGQYGYPDYYYDAARVYLELGKDACAVAAKNKYKQWILSISPQGNVPGYWNFTKGLRLLGEKEAVRLLATNGAWCVASAYGDQNLPDPDYQRENALCGMAKIDSFRLGNGLDARLGPVYLKNALLHLHRQFVLKNAPYVKPFMVALASEFLIQYVTEVEHDSRVKGMLEVVGDGLWADFWRPSARAMLYVNRQLPGDDPPNPAPDLNLLIAPLYGWLYKQTGDAKWKERGDRLFAGGVEQAYLANSKQFNQNYRWSGEYVKWAQVTPTPTPSPTATPGCSDFSCVNREVDELKKRVEVLESE